MNRYDLQGGAIPRKRDGAMKPACGGGTQGGEEQADGRAAALPPLWKSRLARRGVYEIVSPGGMYK